MRITKFLVLAAMLLSITAAAQQRIALVDYMKVPEGGEGEYLEVEQKIWKAMHQEWVNQGKLESWSLWRIPFPGGTDAEYHYATVQIYTDPAQLGNVMSDMNAVFTKVHPGKNLDEFAKRTMASRDLVKSQRFWSWKSFFDPKLDAPTKYLTVVGFYIEMDKWNAYQEMETKHFHPTHQAEINAGFRAGWEGWQLDRPFGMDQPYQFVAVDHYKDWNQYIKQKPEGFYDKLMSKEEYAKRDQLFFETVRLVSLEEWRLVDITAPAPANKK
ncbi:MAG: hypothetical protein HUU34_18290 [Saprospiraceae bacterium]|jgi:hypothetical protein|nr:hypothetical protein [Saprospiraceae bacterium]